MKLKTKKIILTSLLFALVSLFFLISASSVLAADCGNNQESFSFASFLNPIASLAEKVAKDFGYEIALAAAPDPDFCGSDSVGCSGTTPTATVSWTAAPYSGVVNYYLLIVSDVGSWNTGLNTSYTVSSGLANNTLYNWSVVASTNMVFSFYTDLPYGSFTTPNCAPPPTADIKANGSDGPITIVYNSSATLSWSSTNATACTASNGWSGAKATSGSESTGNLTSSKTYTLTCTGPGGSASDSVTVNVSVPPPGNFSLSSGSVTCNSVPLSWTSSSNADGYRILKGSARVDISPYQPYTARNFTDTTVSQNTTYLYQIEAYNVAGANRSNTINVTTPYCPPTVSLSGNPTSVFQGQSSTLTWSSAYTTSCVASGAWSGSKALSCSEVVVPSPPSATYTLTCSGPGGSASDSVTIDITPLALPEWREVIPR